MSGEKHRTALLRLLAQAESDGIEVQVVRHEGGVGGRKREWVQLGEFPWLVVVADARDHHYTAAAHARTPAAAYHKARARLREVVRDAETNAYEGRG